MAHKPGFGSPTVSCQQVSPATISVTLSADVLRTFGVISVHTNFVGTRREMSRNRALHNLGSEPWPVLESQRHRPSMSSASSAASLRGSRRNSSHRSLLSDVDVLRCYRNVQHRHHTQQVETRTRLSAKDTLKDEPLNDFTAS